MFCLFFWIAKNEPHMIAQPVTDLLTAWFSACFRKRAMIKPLPH